MESSPGAPELEQVPNWKHSKKTVQQESEELRRMVTDLRPLRVESADMRELMLGFAERFRNESGLAVDLFIEDRSLRDAGPDLPGIVSDFIVNR